MYSVSNLTDMTPQTALQKAISLAGGHSAVAKHFKIERTAPYQWKVAPPKRAAKLAELTGNKITKEQLRPDIFGEAA